MPCKLLVFCDRFFVTRNSMKEDVTLSAMGILKDRYIS